MKARGQTAVRDSGAIPAGNWMPGQRIEAGSKALDDRNACLKEIKASFEDAWQAL
jgi:hypothetical protein